jgi:KDO2-lipid IV(A) lauroyltransferase
MLPVCCTRSPDGTHCVRLERALEPPGRRREDWLQRMAELNGTVERWVREAPEAWLWLHDRWRSEAPRQRPPGGANSADL